MSLSTGAIQKTVMQSMHSGESDSQRLNIVWSFKAYPAKKDDILIRFKKNTCKKSAYRTKCHSCDKKSRSKVKMASLTAEDFRNKFSCELHIRDLADGRMLDGDCGGQLSPPDNFDMAKFHRGRQFYRHHLFSCTIGMYVSLVMGLSIPEFLEALVFTAQSDTPEKAFKRYARTFHHVAEWHYGNIWETDSIAQKSIVKVRQIHKIVREKMHKVDDGKSTHKFISQYDMGIVLSGFMCAVIMYPEDGGIVCSLDELDDYVYFWYGVGHMLGIQKKYNICAHGLAQALAFCKSIEQDIVKKNIMNPPPEFKQHTEAVIKAFQGRSESWTILTFPVISALSCELILGNSGKLSVADTIRYLIWKVIFFAVKHIPWFRQFLNRRVETISKLTFIEV